MKFIYEPAGGEKREWAFEPNKMLSIEAEGIEQMTGWTFQEFGEKFMSGSTMAYHALLWTLLRRENKSLKYRQVEFLVGEVSVAYSDEEIERLREALDDADVTDEEREALQEILKAAEENPAEPDPPVEPSAE